jgi:carbon storage regulator
MLGSMLVLTRRVGESLVIGDDVVLRVLDVKGDVVRIGVDAPKHVRVHRQEVYDAVTAANRIALSASDDAVAALQAELRSDRTAEPSADQAQPPEPEHQAPSSQVSSSPVPSEPPPASEPPR